MNNLRLLPWIACMILPLLNAGCGSDEDVHPGALRGVEHGEQDDRVVALHEDARRSVGGEHVGEDVRVSAHSAPRRLLFAPGHERRVVAEDEVERPRRDHLA